MAVSHMQTIDFYHLYDGCKLMASVDCCLPADSCSSDLPLARSTHVVCRGRLLYRIALIEGEAKLVRFDMKELRKNWAVERGTVEFGFKIIANDVSFIAVEKNSLRYWYITKSKLLYHSGFLKNWLYFSLLDHDMKQPFGFHPCRHSFVLGSSHKNNLQNFRRYSLIDRVSGALISTYQTPLP